MTISSRPNTPPLVQGTPLHTPPSATNATDATGPGPALQPGDSPLTRRARSNSATGSLASMAQRQPASALGRPDPAAQLKAQCEAIGNEARQLVAQHAKLGDAEMMTACTRLLDQLNSLPATPGSGLALRRPMLETQNAISLFSQRGPVCTQESGPLRIRVCNEQIKKHRMLADEGTMTRLLDWHFRPGSPQQDVVAALSVQPILVMRLEPGTVPKEHVTQMLTEFAQRAQGEHGVQSLPEPLADYWGPQAAESVENALRQHGIELAGDSCDTLRKALPGLRQPHADAA